MAKVNVLVNFYAQQMRMDKFELLGHFLANGTSLLAHNKFDVEFLILL